MTSSSTGSPGPTTGLAGATVTRRSRSTWMSSLAWSNSFRHIRVAVSVKFGNCGAVDRPGDRVVALLECDDLVGQDPVGLPGEQRRAGAVAAVQVDAGLLADLVPLAVGQEPQLGLVFLARDRQHAIGDDRVAEPVGPGDAEDVAAPLRHRRPGT